MPHCKTLPRFFSFGIALASAAGGAAQETPETHHHPASRIDSATRVALGAGGILAATAAIPGVSGRNLAEGYVTQPMVTARVSSRRQRVLVDITLNFEGVTLGRGELNAGMYGEGYVDRRHPHTLLHELMGTAVLGGGMTRLSVSGGKGFVPFGTDDPMSRPFVKYPVNHHLAQVLERAVVLVAATAGPVIAEVASFNGDEPESPGDMPNLSRFADSWAARLTARRNALEAQTSMASVASPEHARGGGLDQRKVSASVRYEKATTYFLAEWAKTREIDGSRTAFVFTSVLAEGAAARSGVTLALRAERTARPEEERLTNVFRTPRPASDLSILGRTRWTIVSASLSRTFATPAIGRYAPFAEVSMQRPTVLVRPTVFEPREFYGAGRLWNFSAGLRFGIGMRHSRMGRYGVAASHDTHPDM
ncbi:MAG TPA: hypothetical protein VHM24_07895 [Gemmatimonadaceae bacterium]|nr:hypothetical protein [Gemmatimonadaceae bacterium]